MAKPLSDQIRDAVRNSELSRNRICHEIGLDKGSMSKFMAGDRGLSLAVIDKLAALLKFRIIPTKRKDG